MTKLIGCIMAGNSEKYINLCIRALLDRVDDLVICYDTTSTDNTLSEIEMWLPDKRISVIKRAYEHDLNVRGANGDQRNFYLDYLKQNYLGEWCLVLDADEVVDENISKVKENLYRLDEGVEFLSPRMVHFEQDLGHEDNTKDKHYVLHRLFKIRETLFYPSSEHPVLQNTNNVLSAYTDMFVIYHLAYCREIFYLKDRYLTHMAKSEMHSQDFLQEWYYAHLFGHYPKKSMDINSLPQIIKEEFLIDDEFFYFQNRLPEAKHYLMASQYRDYFKPEVVFCPGDGRGIFTHAFQVVGVHVYGSDLSEYAVNHSFVKDNVLGMVYFQQDIMDLNVDGLYDLICVMDLLEHLDKNSIPDVLRRIYKAGNENYLFSIPFLGDPNLNNDVTHKVFESKEWWLEQLTNAGFKIEETPSHFHFREQMVVCKK